MLDIVQSKSRSLISLAEVDGERTVKALLVKVITDVISFFNVGKMMNANQVISTASLILEAYPMYKIDDFILCFKRAKLGQYGKIYDRIDGNVLFDWFDKYIEERNTEFENIRTKEKKAIELDIEPIDVSDLPDKDKPVPMPDYIKDAFKKKVVTNNPVKVLNQTEQQKEINKWMYDFDNLWEQQGSAPGKRFVTINLNFSEEEIKKEKYKINKEIDARILSGEDAIKLDNLRFARINKVGFKDMDISEYLQHRHALKYPHT